jgi:hypothetical protein
MAVTPERKFIYVRWGMAVAHDCYKSIAVSLAKRPHNGRFTSETAVGRFQKRNRHLHPKVV